MSEENEVPSDEEILKHITCEAVVFCTYKHPCGTCKGTLIRIKKLLSALRAEWEKEREELVNRAYKWMKLEENSSDKIESLEAEKKGLLVLNDSLTRTASEKNSIAIDRQAEIDRLKAKVAELTAELQATRKACDQAHQNTLDREEERDRLKAENAEKISSLKIRNNELKGEVSSLRDKIAEEKSLIWFKEPVPEEANPGVTWKSESERLYKTWRKNYEQEYSKTDALRRQIDSLTLALAEARDALDKLVCALEDSGSEEPDDHSPGEVNRCLNEAQKALSNPTSQRASEEMKALRKVIQEARKSCACGARGESLDTHPHVGGCELGKAFEDYDKNRGAV